MKKQAIVVHSGGMDSSICLALALSKHGADEVLSLTFSYGQRHALELQRAAELCARWGVDHVVLDVDFLKEITTSALIGDDLAIERAQDGTPTTLVEGRNGLMARVAAIHAKHLGASSVYMGVIEVESANSGYRDCSRHYMDLMEVILRLDLAWPEFRIETPVVFMTKCETLELADQLGCLDELLEKSVTCYRGIEKWGCGTCPACELRNEGIDEFMQKYPSSRERLEKALGSRLRGE